MLKNTWRLKLQKHKAVFIQRKKLAVKSEKEIKPMLPILILITFLMAIVGVLEKDAIAQDLNAKSVGNTSKVDEPHCLTFYKNQLVNKVSQFKKRYHINSNSIIYSASFDLNGDGAPEYFYYLNEPGAPHCGTISLQLGCPLEILQYTKNNEFTYLDDGVVHPGLDFKPDKYFTGYICVTRDEVSGKHDLVENRWWMGVGHESIIQLQPGF